MKKITQLIVFGLTLTIIGCFSYKKELTKHSPKEIEYLNSINEEKFSDAELELLKQVYSIHQDSATAEYLHLKYMLYLYKKKYKISYLDDKNNEKRIRDFLKNFQKWQKGKDNFR